MTEKEFTDLANKHLTVLESYQLDKDGNKQFNIFGYKQLFEAINYTHCCTQLPTIIEIDFDGHLKCQIETTDKTPVILKAVNGYGQPVDCKEGKIRINEI